MQEYHVVAKELAQRVLKKDAAQTSLEDAATVIGHVLTGERKALKAELIEACASLAEEQYGENPDWDRPLYSAMQCGKWIAACIRSQLGEAAAGKLTNKPHKQKLQRSSHAKKVANVEAEA